MLMSTSAELVSWEADCLQSGCRLRALRYGAPRRPDSALRALSRSRRSAWREGGSEAKAGSRTPRCPARSAVSALSVGPCDAGRWNALPPSLAANVVTNRFTIRMPWARCVQISYNDLTTLIERRLQARGKRRHIPVVAMKVLPPLIRPFNEVAARMMSLGHFAATLSRPFPEWKASAERFGVAPRTVEQYVNALPR